MLGRRLNEEKELWMVSVIEEHVSVCNLMPVSCAMEDCMTLAMRMMVYILSFSMQRIAPVATGQEAGPGDS